ncbi:MAG: hypothetical protein HQL79_07605 [Magnetococcales bacterium]|nr:hypothetical protein [Magnetococcales bacterium]
MSDDLVTMAHVELAVEMLAEKEGEFAVDLLRRVDPSVLAQAMVQEVEDGLKAKDYDFLRGLDGMLCRVIELQGGLCG